VKGLRALAVEALGRLGVESGPTRFEQAYNSGQTTQVPAGRVIAVGKRVRRKIGYKGVFMSFERA
jgi:carbamoylphosphate synthase large subunit